MNNWSRIDIAPLISMAGLLWLAVAVAIALGCYALRGGKAPLFRLLCFGILLLALANPSWIREIGEEKPDIVALVLDRSESMNIGNRHEQAGIVFNAMLEKLRADPGLETRIIETTPGADATEIFSALRSGLADAPRERIGGSILITDGQIHDIPENPETIAQFGPVHALIIGNDQDNDRRIEILSAPSFGVVGEESQITVKIHDHNADTVQIQMSVNGQTLPNITAKTGEETNLSLSLPRRGSNLVLMEIDAAPNEPTLANNRAAVSISGIRDRLRVLLVTGQPHAGGRVWRDLLKSDPAVDLVHFTILRPPHKTDATPTRELALIAFPTRELFVNRLHEFDLVILDQYRRRNVLSMTYFDNIARYVADGGALMVAAGQAFASSASIYRTSLASVLPARPTGQIINESVKPQLSALGKRHTVTASLPNHNQWGPWRRYIESVEVSGDTLLETGNNKPLLILDRVGEGRIAMLMSDQLWLWARGHENGGPYGELVRRLAHWLMQEPELEEESLELKTDGDKMIAILRSLDDTPPPLRITGPEEQKLTATWQQTGPGRWNASFDAKTLGAWKTETGGLAAIALKGPSNPKEYQDIRATPDLIAPISTASGGGTFQIRNNDDNLPELKRISANDNAAGRNWIGLTNNRIHSVKALQNHQLIPGILAAAAVLAIMALAWWREGH